MNRVRPSKSAVVHKLSVALTGRGLKYGMPVLKIENCANSQVTLMVRTRASWDCMGILTIRDAHFPHILTSPNRSCERKCGANERWKA